MVIEGYGPLSQFAPRLQWTPNRGDRLMALESLIGWCDRLISNAKTQKDWDSMKSTNGTGSECPNCLWHAFLPRVKQVLADSGEIGISALRKFVKMNFWLPNPMFETITVGLKDRPGSVEVRVPTAEGLKKYTRLVRKVKADLVAIRNKEFLGMEPSVNDPRGTPIAAKVSRRKKVSSRDRNLKRTPYFSPMDDKRYKQIGHDQIASQTNPELWTHWRKEEQKRKPSVNWQGFRHSLNRIRVHYKLPSSADLQKK